MEVCNGNLQWKSAAIAVVKARRQECIAIVRTAQRTRGEPSRSSSAWPHSIECVSADCACVDSQERVLIYMCALCNTRKHTNAEGG